MEADNPVAPAQFVPARSGLPSPLNPVVPESPISIAKNRPAVCAAYLTGHRGEEAQSEIAVTCEANSYQLI
jgi:hypothetical protein